MQDLRIESSSSHQNWPEVAARPPAVKDDTVPLLLFLRLALFFSGVKSSSSSEVVPEELDEDEADEGAARGCERVGSLLASG